jgi:hypothetical protein
MLNILSVVFHTLVALPSLWEQAKSEAKENGNG